MFHTEAANTMYVYAAGQALLRDGMVKGKKWYSLTADYAFGHDLLRVAKRFMQANGGTFAADELVPTNATDFSAYLLKIRNAKPDMVVSNLAGAQITNFMKQYLEYGLPFPVAGFAFRHRGGLGCRQGQSDRHLAAGMGPRRSTRRRRRNLSWPSRRSTESRQTTRRGAITCRPSTLRRRWRRSRSTDSTKVAEHMEKGAKFDVLKTREGYYRNWDHQLMQEMYTIKFKPAARDQGQVGAFHDVAAGAGVPTRASRSLRRRSEDNNCTMPA